MKKTRNLKFELGNVIDNCQKIVRGYCGDMTAIASLINNISVNIYNCDNAECQKQILCEEIEPTKFIYIKINNNSTTVKKSFVGLCEYNNYHLDINIHLSLLRPENESAYQLCKNIVNKIGVNEISEVSKLFYLIA